MHSVTVENFRGHAVENFKTGCCISHEEMPAEKTREIFQNPHISFASKTSSVTKRNERERNRVRLVNEGFTCLRQKIPLAHGKKRLSKVETLRYATDYIKQLQCVIQEHDKRFSRSFIECQEKKTEQFLEHNQVWEDVNERFSDNVDETPGKRGMVKLMSTRAQERWKVLTDNGKIRGSARGQQHLMRRKVREAID